jgi:hypothetical protein
MTPSASHLPTSLPITKTGPSGYATAALSGAPQAGSHMPVLRMTLLASKRGLTVALIAMLVPFLAACPQKKQDHPQGGDTRASLSQQGTGEIPGVTLTAATSPPPEEIPGASATQSPRTTPDAPEGSQSATPSTSPPG